MRTASLQPTLDQCNCFALKRVSRRIARLYDAHLQPTGLRITQFQILAALNERRTQSAPVNALADKLDTERTAMGKMAATLERSGLVTIGPSPIDARARVVALTREGTRLFEKALPLWRDAQRHMERLNGSERVDALRAKLSEFVMDAYGNPRGTAMTDI